MVVLTCFNKEFGVKTDKLLEFGVITVDTVATILGK